MLVNSKFGLTTKNTKHTKVSESKTSELRALRVLRGEKSFTSFLVKTLLLIASSALWLPSFADAAQSKPLIKVVAGYGSTEGKLP